MENMSPELPNLCLEKTRKSEKSSLAPQDSCHCKSESSRSSTDLSSARLYLRQHLSAILPAALGEIALKKPLYPLEYLGQWLLHYRECEERERCRREFEAELLEERLKLKDEVVITDEEEHEEHEEHEDRIADDDYLTFQ